MFPHSLRVAILTSGIFALSLLLASESKAQDSTEQPQGTGLYQSCSPNSLTFSSVCVGPFGRAISFSLEAPLSASQEDRLLRNSVQALEHLGLVLSEDSNSDCRALADNAEFVGEGALPEYPIFSVYLDDCVLQSGNLEIQKLEVVFTQNGGSLELLEGIFHGSPGNHADHGPFYDELVKRYGQNKCDRAAVPRVCFTNALNQQLWIEETAQPGVFNVRLSDQDKRFRREGIEYLRRELSVRENSAPVKSF